MRGRNVIFAPSMRLLTLDSKFCPYSFPIGISSSLRIHTPDGSYCRKQSLLMEQSRTSILRSILQPWFLPIIRYLHWLYQAVFQGVSQFMNFILSEPRFFNFPQEFLRIIVDQWKGCIWWL